MDATVLIVDDDPCALDTFGPMLTSLGYQVRIAQDGGPGLEAVERIHPAAVVVDLHLPTVNGVEFVRRLRSSARHAALPVAVVTGDYLVDEAVMVELRSLGAELFFKPLWEEDLNRIVGRLVATKHCA
jgi:DNA-binding response OmpR family regulator